MRNYPEQPVLGTAVSPYRKSYSRLALHRDHSEPVLASSVVRTRVCLWIVYDSNCRRFGSPDVTLQVGIVRMDSWNGSFGPYSVLCRFSAGAFIYSCIISGNSHFFKFRFAIWCPPRFNPSLQPTVRPTDNQWAFRTYNISFQCERICM